MGKIIVQCDPDIKDLIPGYMSNRSKDIVVMRSCLSLGDFEKIRIFGHSMKGSGGGYGFDTITDLGDRIEIAALANDTNEIEQAIQNLEDYINQVEVVYS